MAKTQKDINAQFCNENILSMFKKLENICQIPLSDTRNHILNCLSWEIDFYLGN